VGTIAAWCGDLKEGERVLRPLREFGPPLVDQIRPMPYTQVQELLNVFTPHIQTYLKADFLQALTDEAIDTIVAHVETVSSPLSVISLLPVNGFASRVDPQATAFPHRALRYHLIIVSQWPDPAEAERHIRWTRDFWEDMHRFAGVGVYVNEIGHDEGEDRYRAAFGVNYDRLVEVKNVYDPTNFWRLNPNIKPSAG